MTETTAKKGMVRYKNGHSAKDFDFDFLGNINYDDKRTLKEVVETLFNQNKAMKEQIVQLKEELQNSITDNVKTLDARIDKYYADKLELKLKEIFKR